MRPPPTALFLAAALACAPAAPAQTSTRISADAPVINFRLPTFTPEGNRSWLVRGAEARFTAAKEIDIKELILTVFTGEADGRVETVILSPGAHVLPDRQLATGDGTIRVVNDNFEASGAQWSYSHREKRVSIAKNVRVSFRAELKDFLK